MDSAAESVPAPPEIAQHLPDYRLVRRLSQTLTSSVWLAEEIALNNRRVALKILSPERAGQADFRARFKREIAMIVQLDHPNIVPVYRAGESGKLCYLAMRYIDGADLRLILRQEGALPLDRTVRLLRQAAAALDAAHEAGLVHRDVKPGNILVDGRTGQVYLTDFGVARGGATETLTPNGETIGTPAYIAPEQIQDSRVDHRADVYALGCIAYECLTGQKPFVRADPLAVLWAHAQDEAPPPTSLRPDLPAAVDTVLARALAKAPDARQPTCTALIDELAGAAGAAATSAEPPRWAATSGSTGVDRPAEASAGPPAKAAGGTAAPAPAPAPTALDTAPTVIPGAADTAPTVIPGAADTTPSLVPPGTGQPAPGPSSDWRRLIPPPLRRRRVAVLALAALLAAVLVLTTALVVALRSVRAGPDVRAAVPEPLRADCQEADDPDRDAVATLSCRAAGFVVQVRAFADPAGVDRAYGRAVDAAGVTRGSGDCGTDPNAEHRYPSVGRPHGRVVCARGDGPATLVWTDATAKTIFRAEVAPDRAAELYQAWTRWTGAPAFPTSEEAELMRVVAEDDCQRPPAGTLDRYGPMLAAVECAPEYAGARSISYYRYGSLADLQQTFDAHASAANAPTGVYCGDGKAEGFLGNRRYDLRSVEVGGLLCHPEPQSTLAIEWSVEPLLLLGRAVGTDPEDLAEWWSDHHGPPASVLTAAVNAQADPPFPSEDEQRLLAQVPEPSRINCMRPSAEQVRQNVPGRTPVAAVVCGPTSGARIVFYYQFADAATMRANYRGGGLPDWPDCSATVPGFKGEGSYARGGTRGRLLCHHSEGAGHYLVWTDERRLIQGFAFQGWNAEALYDWWQHDAGPL